MRVEPATTAPKCVVHVAPVTAVMRVAEWVAGFWSRSLPVATAS